MLIQYHKKAFCCCPKKSYVFAKGQSKHIELIKADCVKSKLKEDKSFLVEI